MNNANKKGQRISLLSLEKAKMLLELENLKDLKPRSFHSLGNFWSTCDQNNEIFVYSPKSKHLQRLKCSSQRTKCDTFN